MKLDTLPIEGNNKNIHHTKGNGLDPPLSGVHTPETQQGMGLLLDASSLLEGKSLNGREYGQPIEWDDYLGEIVNNNNNYNTHEKGKNSMSVHTPEHGSDHEMGYITRKNGKSSKQDRGLYLFNALCESPKGLSYLSTLDPQKNRKADKSNNVNEDLDIAANALAAFLSPNHQESIESLIMNDSNNKEAYNKEMYNKEAYNKELYNKEVYNKELLYGKELYNKKVYNHKDMIESKVNNDNSMLDILSNVHSRLSALLGVTLRQQIEQEEYYPSTEYNNNTNSNNTSSNNTSSNTQTHTSNNLQIHNNTNGDKSYNKKYNDLLYNELYNMDLKRLKEDTLQQAVLYRDPYNPEKDNMTNSKEKNNFSQLPDFNGIKVETPRANTLSAEMYNNPRINNDNKVLLGNKFSNMHDNKTSNSIIESAIEKLSRSLSSPQQVEPQSVISVPDVIDYLMNMSSKSTPPMYDDGKLYKRKYNQTGQSDIQKRAKQDEYGRKYDALQYMFDAERASIASKYSPQMSRQVSQEDTMMDGIFSKSEAPLIELLSQLGAQKKPYQDEQLLLEAGKAAAMEIFPKSFKEDPSDDKNWAKSKGEPPLKKNTQKSVRTPVKNAKSTPTQKNSQQGCSVYSRGSTARHLKDPFPHSIMIKLIQPLPTGIKLELKSHKSVQNQQSAPREYALRVSLTRHETKYCSFHSLQGILPAYNEAVRLRNKFAGLPFTLPILTFDDLSNRKHLLDSGVSPLPGHGPKEAFMTVQERTIYYKQGNNNNADNMTARTDNGSYKAVKSKKQIGMKNPDVSQHLVNMLKQSIFEQTPGQEDLHKLAAVLLNKTGE